MNNITAWIDFMISGPQAQELSPGRPRFGNMTLPLDDRVGQMGAGDFEGHGHEDGGDIQPMGDLSDASPSTTSSRGSTLAIPAEAMAALAMELADRPSSPRSDLETDGVTYICDSPDSGAPTQGISVPGAEDLCRPVREDEATSPAPPLLTIAHAPAVPEVIPESQPHADAVSEPQEGTSPPETPPPRRAGRPSSPPRMRRSRSPRGDKAGGGPSGGGPSCGGPSSGGPSSGGPSGGSPPSGGPARSHAAQRSPPHA